MESQEILDPHVPQGSTDVSRLPSRRQFLKGIGLAATATAMLPLLAACGDDDDEPAPTATNAPAGDEDEETPDDESGDDSDPTEKEDNEDEEDGEAISDENYDPEAILIFGSSVDLPNLDPAVGHDGAGSETQKAVYDTLYRHMGNPAELVPWLATGHEASADATEWTFTLDERARFQDGSPVTAEAVVYSLERVLTINRGVAWMFSGVLTDGNAEAVDDHTVKFTLSQPFAPFLHAITWLFIVNPAVVEEHAEGDDMGQAWLLSNSAGSGPFKIKRWEPGTLYEFESDPDYWRGWETPRLKGYIRQVSRESSTKRLALEQGQMHAADFISVEDIRLLERASNVVVPAEPAIGTYVVKMNNKVGPTSDIHVRRAISYAFDYDGMLQIMEGRAVRLKGPLAPTLLGTREDLNYYETNLEKAREELAKSEQYKDGFDLEFVHVTGLEEQRQTGLILLAQLAELNINVTITPMEWSNAVALFADAEQSPQMFPILSGTDYPDPDNFLWQSYHSSANGTWMGASHYQNEDVDKWLEEARSTADWDERVALYDQVQQTVVDEAAELYIYSQVGGLIRSTKVQGYQFCPVMGSGSFWYQVWMTK